MFGELFQLGHVVPDLPVAVAAWEATGIGPFDVIHDYPVAQWRTGDGAVVDVHVDVALAWSGDVQIELIAPNDAACMYTEYLAAVPAGGLQHYGYRVDHLDDALATATERGWQVWLEGTLTTGRRFCYLRPPADLALLLPVEISGAPA
jgi:hypothetical protein